MDNKTENPKRLYKELKDSSPLDYSLFGYKPYIISIVLSLLTYGITLGHFNPQMIGSFMYFLPLLLICTIAVPFLFESDEEISSEDSEALKFGSLYLMFTILTVFITYFVFVLVSGSVSGLHDFLGRYILINFLVGIIEVIIGLPVIATFYYSICIYYNILIESFQIVASDEE